MATYDLTKQILTYQHAQQSTNSPVVTVKQKFHGPDMTTKKGSAIATNDIFQLIDVPAGALVLDVVAKVQTVEGATCTFHIGDGDTADGYLASVNGNTSANSHSFTCTTTQTFGVGKRYTAADTIDLKLITGTAAAVSVDVVVTMILEQA